MSENIQNAEQPEELDVMIDNDLALPADPDAVLTDETRQRLEEAISNLTPEQLAPGDIPEELMRQEEHVFVGPVDPHSHEIIGITADSRQKIQASVRQRMNLTRDRTEALKNSPGVAPDVRFARFY